MKKLETGRKVIEARFYVPISIFTATTRALWEYMNIHGHTMLYRANEQCGSVGCLFHSKMFLSSWLGHSACLGMQPKFLTCWSLILFFNCFLWLIMKLLTLNHGGYSWMWTSLTLCAFVSVHAGRRCPDRCWFVLAGATCIGVDGRLLDMLRSEYVACNVACNVACKSQRQ